MQVLLLVDVCITVSHWLFYFFVCVFIKTSIILYFFGGSSHKTIRMANVINPEVVKAFMTHFLEGDISGQTSENVNNDDVNADDQSEASESEETLAGTEEWNEIQRKVLAAKENAKNSGMKTISCEMCNKEVTVKNYKKHLLIHTGIKKFTCKICGKGFTQNSTLKYHMKVHMEAKGFKCEICSKEFKCKSDLKRHMAIHTGLKEFKCHLCTKEFAQKDSLNKHIKQIHIGNKEFLCPVCGKAFSLKTYMVTHMKTHKEVKDFKCPACNREFACSSNMRRHMVTHTKPDFTCDLCGEIFTCKTNLKAHIVKHNRVKLKCEICDKNFSQKRSFEKHLAGHMAVKTEALLSEASPESDPLFLGDKLDFKIEVPSDNDMEESPSSTNDVDVGYPVMLEDNQVSIKCEVDDGIVIKQEYDEFDLGES